MKCLYRCPVIWTEGNDSCPSVADYPCAAWQVAEELRPGADRVLVAVTATAEQHAAILRAPLVEAIP